MQFGGRGHTAALYTNPGNKAHIRKFEDSVQTARVLINTPSSQGAIGDLYNFRLDPSLTWDAALGAAIRFLKMWNHVTC